ncbi:hypothetical protein AK830_g11941 [Neonectria ditissima]|uniref:Uncharacterized protein n=1 Tax=Neonectria ditissima TaxID=78410 RepID=A0A0P7AL24_9HYPO|nr:hypothetical protein AK830_g11941 [Neonectria ditissima]
MYVLCSGFMSDWAQARIFGAHKATVNKNTPKTRETDRALPSLVKGIGDASVRPAASQPLSTAAHSTTHGRPQAAPPPSDVLRTSPGGPREGGRVRYTQELDEVTIAAVRGARCAVHEIPRSMNGVEGKATRRRIAMVQRSIDGAAATACTGRTLTPKSAVAGDPLATAPKGPRGQWSGPLLGPSYPKGAGGGRTASQAVGCWPRGSSCTITAACSYLPLPPGHGRSKERVVDHGHPPSTIHHACPPACIRDPAPSTLALMHSQFPPLHPPPSTLREPTLHPPPSFIASPHLSPKPSLNRICRRRHDPSHAPCACCCVLAPSQRPHPPMMGALRLVAQGTERPGQADLLGRYAPLIFPVHPRNAMQQAGDG